MVRRIWVLSLLAMLFAPPGMAQSAAKPVDPATIQALKDLGAHLQTLKRFTVYSDATGEKVLASGQKLQHSAMVDMAVDRPNKVHVAMATARNRSELIYDGKTVTLNMPAQKAYSTFGFSGSLVELAKRLDENYGVEIPLSDLFVWGTPEAPVDKIESAMNAGQDFIGKDLCDHYAFRQGKIDWEIWVTTGPKPLPRMIVINNLADEARPQSTHVLAWNLKPTLDASVFNTTPPKGATKVEFVPLKTK